MINKSKPKWTLPAGLAGLMALAGCTVGPDFSRPDWRSPASWFTGPKEMVKPVRSLPVAEPVDPNWWTLFHDPVLTGLEQRVAAENLDVKVAAIRLAESRRPAWRHSGGPVPHSERQCIVHPPAGQR